MATIGRRLFGRFGDLLRPKATPRQYPSAGFDLLNHVPKLEEENWEWYSPDEFYPVKIGETFQSRYQVVGKLGYGAHSTVWLCRDLSAHKILTMKVCTRDSHSARRELAAYKHLAATETTHAGSRLVRQLHDSFELINAGGEHICLVHDPLAISLETFTKLLPAHFSAVPLLKSVVKYTLLALDFMHSEAKMVHTDVQARNIQFAGNDDSIFHAFEQHELNHPSRRKVDGDRIIYESAGLKLPKNMGHAILCDLGEARHGQDSYTDLIQPSVFRAPEVLLDVPWTYSADVWNVGVLTWHCVEDSLLFKGLNTERKHSIEHHLAELIATLGPPPVEFLRRSSVAEEYFDIDGTWKGSVSLPSRSLEDLETKLKGENKDMFLQFIRKALQWEPEKRPTAGELLEDPWLTSKD